MPPSIEIAAQAVESLDKRFSFEWGKITLRHCRDLLVDAASQRVALAYDRAARRSAAAVTAASHSSSRRIDCIELAETVRLPATFDFLEQN